MSQLFSNNASSVLVEDLLVAATSVNLAPGEGDQFPLPDSGDPDSFAMLTLEDVSGNIEVVKLTSRVGDTLTIERAQESTSPLGFATGSRIEARMTAGTMDNFKQIVDQYDVRGKYLETDGIRIWHEQDPSTYQFFSLRYYTDDVFGVTQARLGAPAGISGLSAYLSINRPDGSVASAGITPDFNTTAPFPGTGEVMWRVPGQQMFNTINNSGSSPQMYLSWEDDTVTSTFKFQFAADKTNPVSFEFRCRDEFEVESKVTLNKNGTITMRYYLEMVNYSAGTYTEATPLWIQYIPDIFNPGVGDWLLFQRNNHSTSTREMAYLFNVREKTGDTTYESHSILLGTTGTIRIGSEVAISDDQDLTTKAYVDGEVTAATTGAGLNTLAASFYGRTVLYNNDGGAPDGVDTNLTTGAFSDYYQIEITSKEINSGRHFSFQVDTQTLTEKGYGTPWEIVEAAGTGGDVRILEFKPQSDTSFRATQVEAGTNRDLVRIVGLFPKNPGGV